MMVFLSFANAQAARIAYRSPFAISLGKAHGLALEGHLMIEGPLDINVTLARAIVDTVHEPLLVLNEQLRVVVASRSFYTTFQIGPEETQGKLLYDLSDGEWNIAALRLLLDRIVPASEIMEDFAVEQMFPRIGRRTMLLNARRVHSEGSEPPTILLAFEDITERRTSERALKSLLEQKDILLATGLRIRFRSLPASFS
jgi:PAS domain S-box-containing protein